MVNKKILYVDDEQLNLMLLKLNLRNSHEVITTDNPHKGLELLSSEEEIGVVISDMKMPNMSGIEFVKQVKVAHPDMKCFVLTGLEETTEIQEAIQSGILLGYFKKPFNPEEIVQSLDNVLG